MKHLLSLLICLVFTFPASLSASHLMGGEITWRCDGSGNFIFKVKLYRDCNGIPGPSFIALSTNTLPSTISCSLLSQTDISPVGPGCPTCNVPMGVSSAIEEFIYESAPTALNGTPPPSGWGFYYTDCCRNASISNLAAGNGEFVLRAVMYPYIGAGSGCSDNSPEFAISPSIAMCSGDSIRFTHAAFDPDLDSLTYSWDTPLYNGYPGLPYPFNPGYSSTSPLPGPSQNPANQAAILDLSHGIISAFSNTTGSFVTVTNVRSFKCGQLVSEIFREVQMTLIQCPIANAPTTSYNTAPNYSTGNETETFQITAGDTFFYNFHTTDFNIMYTPNPSPQAITLKSFGIEFGDGDTSFTSGCLVPPCATLSLPTPITGNLMIYEGLTWPTACSHAGFINGCLQHIRTFQFVFTATDNYCPANGIRHKSLLVSVVGPVIYSVGNDLAVSYPGVSLQWYLNGVPIPGATDTIITPTQSGVYTVLATTGSGCQMISNPAFRTFAGQAESVSSSSISLYPNPATSDQQLHLLVQNIKTGQQMIKITDITGKLVKSYPLDTHNATEHLVLDISGLQAGMYHLSLSNSSESIQESFVIK